MTTIEFKIPEFGENVGTTKWVVEKLKGIKFYQGKLKNNADVPCLHYSFSDKPDVRYIFCTVLVDSDKLPFIYSMNRNFERNYCSVYPIERLEEWGLFDYLTPTAYKYVKTFIDEVSKKWLDELEKL